nr:IS66 family insertion sequence element accessory protein TnpB [Bradyrhizobium rifense]
MIPIPSGVRVWIATGHTDVRVSIQGLSLTVQKNLKRDSHAGDFSSVVAAAICSRLYGITR